MVTRKQLEKHVDLVGNFIRVIFEGPEPVRVFVECLQCDEPLEFEVETKEFVCYGCNHRTSWAAFVEHCKSCVRELCEDEG